MRLFLRRFRLILAKDLRLYFSGAATLWACALFSLAMLSLFRFTAPPDQFPALAGIAVMVGTHLTSSVFLLLAGQEWEWEWLANRALLLEGARDSSLFIGKVAGYAITLSLLWLFTFFSAVVLLGLRFPENFTLPAIGAGLLLSIGMSLIGLLSAAIALHTRFRQLVMFLLYLPLALPSAIAVAGILRMALEGRAVSAEWNLLLAFSLVFFAAGLALFDYLMEE